MFKKITFFSILFFTFSCSKGKLLGTIEGNKIYSQNFKNELVKEYAFNADKLDEGAINSIFREYATNYVFMKEGEAINFFEKPEIKESIEKKKNSIIKMHIGKMLWEKDIAPNINLTDKDYEPYSKKFKLRHILVTTESRRRDEAIKIINEVMNKLKAGESFDELARKYSEDPGSKDKGGDLGWNDASTPFVVEFHKAVFNDSVKKGDLIGPVETGYGFHIILIEDQKLEDINSLKNNKSLKDKLTKSKAADYAKNYMEMLREKYKNNIEFYPERLKEPEKYKNEYLYRIKNGPEIKVGDAINILGNFNYQKDIEKLKENIKRELIDPELRLMEAKEKGYHNDETIQKYIKFDIMLFKGQIYREYLRNKYLEEEKNNIKDEDIKNFYEQNKERYKDKKNNYIKFDNVKEWVKDDIVFNRVASKMANTTAELFRKYKTEINI
ncbi:MAG TPA: peptidylprolyl isomerase [Spirochaetota bacterium]|nr:peptidylprolyl isomerase [Spirochaetota bacterium]HOM38528.1 peptidylprolyl isomerase [Spirochaetota bacterium]HPQ49068.1 peptidylprolyl isomerase [Spirochaetota bacterium]